MTASVLPREKLVDWYRRNRARSRALFELISEDAYFSQPITLRHPIVFYEGHLPAFSYNTLGKKALGREPIDNRLEQLFARGIDPHESRADGRPDDDHRARWPSRREVRAFATEADRQVETLLEAAELDVPGNPLLESAAAAYTILEHEAMHQETLLYIWHRLPFEQKRRPVDYHPITAGGAPPTRWCDVPAGRATLGVDRGVIPFGWDNEFGSLTTDVDAFRIQQHDVTNERYLEFVGAGGYTDPSWWTPVDWAWIQQDNITHPLFWEQHDGEWQWRGMFELLPLPLNWPVYVSQAEASAYARWNGSRLMTEAEFQRAAYGSNAGERQYPWGDSPPTPDLGVFDFASWDPQPVGSHPDGASAWGIEDLVGNGWEWTSTTFAPFPGFTAMATYPEYSADFFDGEHVVMKGASPVTARELLRPTFRNWFRARYPYVYATFRCVRDGK
ncbi:MAG TPA: SUMF1/EgtB/PvdO family nonheme iron enzyme [Gemmatimonadales bacterium]|jgi:ergothioneine biosynthesis protein EgtB